MERRRHLLGLLQPNVLGQKIVYGIGQLFRGDAGLPVKVEHLASGMNPGIGAAGAMDGDRASQQLRKGLLNLLLYRGRVLLPLPATVLRTVVFTDSPVPHATAPKCRPLR